MSLHKIRLSVIACHGAALASGAQATFDAVGGTIGRDADNTFVLLDDHGMVAQRHAAISARDDGWRLRNISEHASIALNGGLLAPGMETELGAGDIVNIGTYMLRVDMQEGLQEGLKEMPDYPLEPLASRRPFPELASTGVLANPGGHVDAFQHAAAGLDNLLDTPVDPLSLFGTPDRNMFGSSGGYPSTSGLFAELLTAQPAEAFAALPAAAMHGHAIRDSVPEIGGHLRLRVARGAGATPLEGLGVPARDDAALMVEAFLDGAGVTLDEAAGAGLTPEFMRGLGALVRALRR